MAVKSTKYVVQVKTMLAHFAERSPKDTFVASLGFGNGHRFNYDAEIDKMVSHRIEYHKRELKKTRCEMVFSALLCVLAPKRLPFSNLW